MTNAEGDPGQSPSGQESIDRRAWSRERQLRAVGIAVAAAIAIVLGTWAGGRLFGRHEAPPAEAPAPPGTFRATPQQLKTLTVESVQAAWVRQRGIDRRQDRGQRRSRHAGVFALFGAGHPGHRGAGRYRQSRARRLPPWKHPSSCRRRTTCKSAAAQVKLARINETRKHALVRGQGRQPAGLAAGAGRPDRRGNRIERGAQPPEDPRQIGRANRTRWSRRRSSIRSATITAPIAGVVVDRQVGPGQYLQAGAVRRCSPSPIPRAFGCSPMCARPTPARCKLGQPVEVRVLAYPKRTFKARVTYVAALIDPVTHRLPVRAEIDNHDRRAEAGDVREFPHSHQRCHRLARGAGGRRGLRRRGRACVGGRRRRPARPTARSAPGAATTGWSRCSTDCKPGERIVTKGGLFIDQAAVPASS